MPTVSNRGVEVLISNLDHAVVEPSPPARAAAVKRVLAEAIRAGGVELPERFYTPKPEVYARRLLHRDPERGYSAVVMTWGPGQGTQLHDHAGIWCVEGTVHGEMEVLQFELAERSSDGRCRFVPRGRVRAFPGSAGALIPPFEYHVLRNGLEDQVSVTLHVYGGEMNHCHVFLEEDGGWHRRAERALGYDD